MNNKKLQSSVNMTYKQKQEFIALSLIVQMTIEVYVSEKSGKKNSEKRREKSLC